MNEEEVQQRRREQDEHSTQQRAAILGLQYLDTREIEADLPLADGVLDVPMKAEVIKATLLAAPETGLTVNAAGTHTKILLPAAAPDKIATVVRLDVRGVPVIDAALKP